MARYPGTWGLTLAAALTLSPLASGAGVMEGEPLPPTAMPEPAARSLTIPPGYATVYRFDSLVETVVVGNTTVLSASVLDPREIVLTALGIGRTNVIVLGADGRTLAQLFVRVRQEGSDTVRVFNGTSRALLVCEPDCVPLAEAPGDPTLPRPAEDQ